MTEWEHYNKMQEKMDEILRLQHLALTRMEKLEAMPAGSDTALLEALKYARRHLKPITCDCGYLDAVIKKAEGGTDGK